MPNTPGVPDHAAAPVVEADARNRAIRTFLQGLAVDVVIALSALVHDVVLDESTNWKLVGLLALKTVATATASYVMRKVSPPAT